MDNMRIWVSLGIVALGAFRVFSATDVTIPAPGGVGDVVALTNALAKLAAVPDAGRRDGAIRLSRGIYDLRGVRMSETSHLVVPLWAGGRIVGLGKTPGETVLRGGGADEGLRVMRVFGGGNYAWTTVSNLTVCGGYTKGDGGGILGSSTVDYRDLVVSNNWALGSNAGGGGGCMQGRAFDCTFADNHAGGGDCVVVYGGGFWTGGTGRCGLTDRLQGAWNCAFRDNTCTWQGGALKVDGIVRGCTYRGNTASAYPDAVDSYTQKLQLTADEHAALAARARAAGKSVDAYARDAALAETSRPIVKDGETVAFLGDSITSYGSYPAGYINMVMKGLEIAGVRDAKKICAGIGGQTSVHMHARLERDILAKKPQWMTFSCGVNDVWHGRKGVPLAKYRELVGDIFDRCEKAGVKVIVLTATMIGEDPANENNLKLAAYNDWLRAEAKRRNLPLADLDADMRAALARHRARHPGETGNALTTDGVHMAFPGNCMMAWGVLRAMGVDPALKDRVFAAFARMPQAYGEKVALTVEEWELVKRRADAEKVSVNEYILRASGVR